MKKKLLLLITVLLAALLGGCALPGAASEKELSYREQGIGLLEAGEYELAIEMFDLALEQTYGFFTKTELDICYYKALSQYKNGDIIDALNTYDGITGLKKKDWRAYYLRGSVYLESGDFEGALKDYKSAAMYNGKDTDMLLQIAVNLENADDEEDALYYYSLIQENGGKNAKDKRNIARACYRLGDKEGALEYLNETIEEGDVTAVLYLAEIQMEDGEYDSALSLIEEALTAEDMDDEIKGRFMFAKVVCYEYMAEWDNAKSAIEEYTAAYPNDEAGLKEYIFLSNR